MGATGGGQMSRGLIQCRANTLEFLTILSGASFITILFVYYIRPSEWSALDIRWQSTGLQTSHNFEQAMENCRHFRVIQASSLYFYNYSS